VVVAAARAGFPLKLLWQIAGIAVDAANRKTQVGRRRIVTPRGKKFEIRKAIAERNPLPSSFQLLQCYFAGEGFGAKSIILDVPLLG
jgi:hypothetical protein